MSVEEGKQKRENRKAKDRKDTRPMRCRAAGRCGSILPLTTILTIGYETFSPTLINVATHSQFINTSIIWGGGWMRPRAFLLIRSQFSASAKTRQHGGLQPCCVFITVVSRLCKTSRLFRATLILIQHTSFSIHVTFVLAGWLPHQRSLFEPDRVFLCT